MLAKEQFPWLRSASSAGVPMKRAVAQMELLTASHQNLADHRLRSGELASRVWCWTSGCVVTMEASRIFFRLRLASD